MKRELAAAAAIGMTAILFTGSAVQASVLASRSFGGEGWNQSSGEEAIPLEVDFTGVNSGAISFDMQRSGDIPAGKWETVFELMGRRSRRVLRVRVSWSTVGAPDHPVFYFQGSRRDGGEYYRKGMGLWGPFVVVGRTVEKGEWIHVDLVWDDSAGTYSLLVDGVPARPLSKLFSASRMEWGPDRRRQINEELRAAGEPPPYETHPFKYFLEKATVVSLGYERSSWALPDWGRASPLRNALLEDFVVTEGEVVPPGELTLSSVDHDAARTAGYSGKLVAGDTVTVTVEGTPGAEASFDVMHVTDRRGRIALDWRGWGVYLEEKAFFDDDEVDIDDVRQYRVYAAGKRPDPSWTREQWERIEPTEILDRDEQSVTLERLEREEPYYIAVLALMRGGAVRKVIWPMMDLPMSESEGSPGTYEGTFTPRWGDRYETAAVHARLASGSDETSLIGDDTFAVDPSLSVEVTASESELEADEQSTSEITVTVTDANGSAVSGHEVRFVLATTSGYTGVVGGGAFADEVGGTLDRDFSGETDLFGQVTTTYRSGFAAKTAIIVARDMVSSDTGAAWVKTYINAAAELELEPVDAVAMRVSAAGYRIEVTSSDEWLTADGESEARITALVTQNGQPVEGHRIRFLASRGLGKIRVVRGETGRNGKAQAVFTAGTKVGVARIIATDRTAGISGGVKIELRSDAPAKIALALSEERLPADGRSTADLLVTVTDINDNPSEGVAVEYAVTSGDVRIGRAADETDRRGEAEAEIVAGRSPGRASIEVTVRSLEPTDEELLEARNLAVAVPD